MEGTGAGAADFKLGRAGLLRFEREREFLVCRGERTEGDSLAAAGIVGVPNDADGDLRGGGGRELNTAVVGGALDEVETRLAHTARLGAGQFDRRRAIADELALGIHDDGLGRADGVLSPGGAAALAGPTSASPRATAAGIGRRRRCGCDGVVKFAIIEHLAP